MSGEGKLIGGLVLAAGAGTRFGGGKLLAPLHGRPVLEHALRALAAATGIDRRIVVLGYDALRVRERVDLCGAEAIVCADWQQGQSATLRAGVSALQDCNAVIVLLGDQPGVSAAAIEAVLAAREADIQAIRAAYSGQPGHPVLLERSLFAAVQVLEGDVGARELLRRVPVRTVPCERLARGLDVDTPEDLAAAQQLAG